MRGSEVFEEKQSYMKIGAYLGEMTTLRPEETGLDFVVFASPKGGEKHSARIKVTLPPWGSKPEAIYSLQPFEFVEGTRWLSKRQERALQALVDLNLNTLINFWEGRIIYDDELHSKIVGINDAPPANRKEAIAVLRVIAPKVKKIQWGSGQYHLIFDHMPSQEKLSKRFGEAGYTQPLVIHNEEQPNTITLWTKI